MFDFLTGSWPWYISGPLLGLMVPILMFLGNKHFGVSSSFQHICTAALPLKSEYFQYNWKEKSWSIVMMIGVIIGAAVAVLLLDGDQRPNLSNAALKMFAEWGVLGGEGFQPAAIFSVSGAFSPGGLISLVVGGFLVGFGTRYGNGCTSGHAIMGLSLMNFGSLVAMISFFAGGTLVSWFVVPLVMSLL